MCPRSIATRLAVTCTTCYFWLLPTAATAQPPPCIPGGAGFGDFNVDGDRDADDWSALAACLTPIGHRVNPPFPLEADNCVAVFDGNSDFSIDLRDAARFQIEFTGPCTSSTVVCPPGTYAVHDSGSRNDPDLDTTGVDGDHPELSREFTCEPVQSCEGVRCSGRGVCRVMGGQAVCACDKGYVGDQCERCAVGYEESPRRGGGGTITCVLGDLCRDRYCSGQGECRETQTGEIVCVCDPTASGQFCENGGGAGTLRPPPWVVITGTDQSVQIGEIRTLTVRPTGGGPLATNFTWELEGPGLVFPTTGNEVIYECPTCSNEFHEMAKIKVCTEEFPDQCAIRYLTIDPPGGIRSSGQSHDVLRPLDDMVRSFMKRRCVGAAILGVSVFGKVVHLKGFGNMCGAPTNSRTYLEDCGDTFDVSNAIPGFPLPEPEQVRPDTPMRIASLSKAVGAAVLRKKIRESGLLGPDPSNDDIEAMELCDDAYDLLPADVAAVLCGDVPPPVTLITSSGLFPDCDNDDPCPFGGTCDEFAFGADYCKDCPSGFGGFDCSINDANCPDLSEQADFRWQLLTLGDVLLHRSGLPREPADKIRVGVPRIGDVRGLTTMFDWAQQEDALTSECGFPGGCFDSEFPNFDNGKKIIDPGYFVPLPTVAESLKIRAGTCLLADPGDEYRYSNTGFSMLSLITENVSGQSFAGKVGRPGLHSGSALEDFLEEDLGVPLPGQQTDKGMYVSETVFSRRNTAEPVYRHWSSSAQSFYYLTPDRKRPHCNWTGSDCDFSDWVNADLRINWDFEDANTLNCYHDDPFIRLGGRGALATESQVYLKFMSRYWVSNNQGDSDPTYGQSRCPNGQCIWTNATTHNGALTGTWSYALQLGGGIRTNRGCSDDSDCNPGERCLGPVGSSVCVKPNTYKLPVYDACLHDYSDDASVLVTHKCHFPVGVDIFVVVNQRRDKKCDAAENLSENDPNHYTCDEAYGLLDDYIYHGVCHVQWPPNPYVLWPQVVEGGSSMGFEITGRSVSSAARGLYPTGLSCCGDGIKEGYEACDGTDFGGASCGSYGYEMGDLNCVANCGTIDTSGCSGGTSLLPPASYGDCGYSLEECNGDPALCFADGDCLGGPCARTQIGDFNPYALTDPFNFQGEFHPDGNFRDSLSNLYYCRDDTGAGEMTCINQNGWGVCKACNPNQGNLATGIGCSCNSEGDCDNLGSGLGCFGEDFGGGPGFCWDNQDGPPAWQCAEGTCGQAPWFQDDEMYCEHYSISGEARCQPWYACNAILARICAGENAICQENALGCTDDDCCTSVCFEDSDCSQANGWPPGYTCENTAQGLQCVP